ncbi:MULTISPECIES: cardiolipin synthase ClsB [unclassified Variovorax]|uniref:cardiolipin synthase ClsB n=1 Tax=unclassified Variovorax TaxID=663243 RepID=UPI00076D9831|nr:MULTISPECIES: cardiolipin synthase ClsB [unclassified Variovorax]KWT96898.1 Cardiolipin synthetase [Variovorax sp. WDL1]PNG58715.1 Cardiolipin synthase B [Variovorax sp. B4]PNG61495.1 Cardiolipin synthase B [Variovorax sp. B2]VTV12483.1 Putative cardiolipin synthase YbhO [Variovorax sp. WDL1]
MAQRWTSGNRVEVLENGEQFFPRVFEAIRNATREVIVETFILFEDKVGLALREALREAALRGVKVDLMIDGFGSPDLSDAFIQGLTAAGARVRVFDPGRRFLGQRLNLFRRMHRKITVIDGRLAFVGGINFSADHLMDFGPKAKQDYAVELEGPIVSEIHRFVLHAIAVGNKGASWFRRRLRAAPAPANASAGEAEVQFVTRDNRRHTNDIERHYLAAIRSARQRIVIANAYFFPGYRLIKALRRAARRGVEVNLILQGEPDMQIVKVAASMLYHHLLHAGVHIHEYCQRPLHGKVALVDDRWSTIGSSNLDPLSLSLNLEANVIVRDAAFASQLGEKLEALMRHHCKKVDAAELSEWSAWRLVRSFFVFHLLRWYPSWVGWLPRHAPRLHPLPGQGPHGGAARTDNA